LAFSRARAGNPAADAGLRIVSVLSAVPLFFVSGVFGPANWQGLAAAAIADASPGHYAIAIFQNAFYGYQTSQSTLPTDFAVMAGFAVAATAASAIGVRFGVTH